MMDASPARARAVASVGQRSCILADRDRDDIARCVRAARRGRVVAVVVGSRGSTMRGWVKPGGVRRPVAVPLCAGAL